MTKYFGVDIGEEDQMAVEAITICDICGKPITKGGGINVVITDDVDGYSDYDLHRKSLCSNGLHKLLRKLEDGSSTSSQETK